MDFGLSVAVNRSMAFYSGKESPELFNNAFKAGRLFLTLSNALAGSFLIAAAFLLPKFFTFSAALNQDVKASLLLFGIWTFLRGPLSVYSSALVARQKMASANIVAILTNAVRIFLSLALVSKGWGLTGLIVSAVVAEAAGDLINRAVYLRAYKFPGKSFGMPGGEIFKEMSTLGMQYWLVNLAYMFFYGNDSLIVGYLFGAAAAAVYFTTKLPSFFVFQLVFRLSDNSGPAISELFATGNLARLRGIYFKLLRYSLLAALPLAVGIISFNKSIVSLWVGPGQYAGELMSVGLAFFAVTQIVTHLNAAFIVAFGNLDRWPALALGMAVVGLGLSVLLGKVFGIQGVFIGIVLADFPVFYYLSRKTIHLLEINVRDVLMESVRSPFYVSMLLTLLGILSKFFNFNSFLLGIIGAPVVFVILWAILLYRIGLQSSEKIEIYALFKGKL